MIKKRGFISLHLLASKELTVAIKPSASLVFLWLWLEGTSWGVVEVKRKLIYSVDTGV